MKTNMIYLRWMLVLLATFHCANVSAQWKVGVQAGYTHNSLSTTSGYAYDRNYDSKGGFTVGIPVQYEFVDWFALQADLSYTQKNYFSYRSHQYRDINSETKNGFMQLPVYAHFSFGGEKLRGFVNAGAYAGYWVSSKTKGNQNQYFYSLIDPNATAPYHFDEKVPFDSRRDNRFDGGLMIGLGLKYQLTPQIQLLAEGRYYRGLTDLQKNYMLNQVHRYNDTFTLQLGCMFTLGDWCKKK
ncbi:porin family protein [Parabacteroides sp. APC149_11_2_Y6]